MPQEFTLQSAASINTVPILILLFLLYFLRANWRYEVNQTAQFMPPTLFLMILIVLDNLDFYAFNDMKFGAATQLLHRIVGMLEYDVRILLMSFLISIVADRLSPRKNTKFWTVFPAICNVFVLLPCLFTDWFFMYDETGNIIRGPLHYEPHFLSALYLLFLFALAFMARSRGRTTETGILFITGTSVTVAVLVEMAFKLRGILLSVIALSIMGYYIYVHIEHFRYDNLTGVLNREAFNVDIERYGINRVSHVLSIDLNGLKVINDTMGHEEGDKALKTVAGAISDKLLPNCRLYRIGGDEFAAVCMSKTTEEVERMIENMYAAVEVTGYSCAVGYAEWQNDKTFMEVYKIADDAMYTKKRSMKEITASPMRVK
ncbi:MAG: GGDEF domain-containing protein [Ruminiclostridium sp.]|nr:GGDEF domain-containing protein [Ruminiclostridium sp.]